ncbi:valine--tRNA ligase [Candidatus Woesearchaeota archaeon]|nr:valine--tRNA ligase [Candidatus Woesearchaeota archaeon]
MELPKHYHLKEAEKKWQEWWIKEKVYAFDAKAKGEIFSIDTPPPTVSGRMHLGHALAYSQLDFVARFQRMQGKNIFFPWGFDDNGLATERYVEKKCNVRGHLMSRPEFIKLCLRETKDVEEALQKDWQALGLSPDWNINYRTIDEGCRRVSQISFIALFEQGREYRKEAPTIWCPECQTAIAQVELQDKELDSFFNDIVFKVEGKDLIVATTRPELLGSCVALFAHPEDIRYQKYFNKKVIVPLFNQEVPILADERADPEKGTGIVMCCTFGDQIDIEWYKAHNLPLRISIEKDGKMNALAEKYEGLPIKKARAIIIEDLKNARLLLSQKPIRHTVNVHERCGIEVEILNTKQWFIRYLDLKEEFLKLGNQLRWHPEHMKVRFENWVKGLRWDWCISRQRFFGIPFPVWYCTNCREIILAEKKDLPVDPTVDKPKKACPKCKGKDFEPEKDVLDTWATSSLTPMIALQWGEDEKFFQKMFPMSLRQNGHDIITFWLFNTVVKSYLHEKKLPWKDVMINGFVLDPKGRKMSKSKGNVIEPREVLETFGADALRFWAASSKLGDDIPFKEKELVAGQRMITKLWNASRFAMMHLQDFDGKKPKSLAPIDAWILSPLQRLVQECTAYFQQYDYSKTKMETEKFFWHMFCDQYLELVKDRLYNKEGYSKEAIHSAKYTLYTVLLTILKLLAPILPHSTEEIYQRYFQMKENEKSIHRSSWPRAEKSFIDEDVEQIGEEVVKIVNEVRKYKTSKGMSLSQELEKIIVHTEHSLKEVEKDILAVAKAKSIDWKKGSFAVNIL